MTPKSAEARVERVVRLFCLRQGCPRSTMIQRDELMPVGTASVQQDCPWHERSGNKTETVIYRDAAGKELADE